MGRLHGQAQLDRATLFEGTISRLGHPAIVIDRVPLAAALETIGISKGLWHNSTTVGKKIERLDRQQRTFIDSEI
ncbi:MAG: hypothetical protein J7K65_04120 [Planctomycetes bacterium]|nr:hypothetical protein [Planctomycetota bacterium]